MTQDTQIIEGFVISGVSAVIMAMSAHIKSVADREQHPAQKKSLYVIWGVIVVLCCIGTGFGGWLIKKASDEAGAKSAQDSKAAFAQQINEVKQKIDDAKLAIAHSPSDSRDGQTNNAKEKIQKVDDDFSHWADEFVANHSINMSKFAQSKAEFDKKNAASEEKELEDERDKSATAYPAIAFTIKNIRKMIQSYATKMERTDFSIDSAEITANFYTNQPVTYIRCTTNVFCEFIVGAGLPEGESYSNWWYGYLPDNPYLNVRFGDKHNRLSGDMFLVWSKDRDAFRFNYYSKIGVPNSETVNGDFKASDFEPALGPKLKSIIEAQLLQWEQQ